MVRKLKGLEEVVSISILDPRLTDKAWRSGGFDDALPGAQTDPPYRTNYLYDIYQRAKPGYTGQITAPVLQDTRRETIVNNASADIIRMPTAALIV